MPFIDEQNAQTARNSLGGLTHVVTDFNALRALDPFEQAGTALAVYGVTFQDGLGGVFVWNPTDTTADNGSTVIQPRSVVTANPGRWNLWVGTSGDAAAPISPGAGILGVIDSVPLVAAKTVVWEVQGVKGAATWSHTTTASHDGTTPTNVDYGISMAPGSATYDFVTAVDIVGANMRLTVLPTTGGWTFSAKRISQIAP